MAGKDGSVGTLKQPKKDHKITSSFTTEAQSEFRRRGPRRFAGAAVAVLGLLLVLVWLGPDQQTIKHKFENYGAPGELKIMPEISIDEGADRRYQLPKSLQKPPPPAIIEPMEKDLDPKAKEEVSVPDDFLNQLVFDPVVPVDPDAEKVTKDQVELKLPQQSNPDWYILEEVRPEYPIAASEDERRMPIISVKAAIFVGPDGTVLEKMILATNGSRVFAEEVLNALGKWKFGWRVEPGEGRWIEMTWNFKSPYFIGSTH